MTYQETAKLVDNIERVISSGGDRGAAESQAKKLLDTLDNINDGNGVDDLRIRVLIALSSSLWLNSMAKEALEPAIQALDVSKKIPCSGFR